MTAVATQRCLHHFAREAVARCPECTHYYCRECITEHEDRVICAACLKKLVAAETVPRRERWKVWAFAQIAAGLVISWLIFYSVGLRLLRLPAEFHDDKVWEATFMKGFASPGARE